MSFSKISGMKLVKQISLRTRFKSMNLLNRFIVVFPLKLGLRRVFCQWFNLGGSSCLGFRLWSRKEFPPVGVDWCGFYFLFPGLLCFLVPCHWVRWLRRFGQSDDIQAPLRPGSFTCHLGRCRATIPTDLIRTQTSWRLEALSWARDRMGRCVQSSAKPLFQSKRLKIRDHLDEMFRSSGVTLPLQGGHCSLQPSPGWLETGPERSGKCC